MDFLCADCVYYGMDYFDFLQQHGLSSAFWFSNGRWGGVLEDGRHVKTVLDKINYNKRTEVRTEGPTLSAVVAQLAQQVSSGYLRLHQSKTWEKCKPLEAAGWISGVAVPADPDVHLAVFGTQRDGVGRLEWSLLHEHKDSHTT